MEYNISSKISKGDNAVGINSNKNEYIHVNIEFEYLLLWCKLSDGFYGIEYQPLMYIDNKNKKLVDNDENIYI
jgi:hypothetical protein